MQVKIYTDGAARGNPDGPGGYGTVLEYVDSKGELHTRELSQGYKRTTNNRMELMAVIAGLEALNRPCQVELYSDSKYVVDAFNQHWIDGWIKKGWKRGKNEPVKNIDLWQRLLKAKAPHQVQFIWVKGHDGHPQNERCDTLATTAADGDALIEDEGTPAKIIFYLFFGKNYDIVTKASKTSNRSCKRRKAAGEERPGFTGQDAG